VVATDEPRGRITLTLPQSLIRTLTVGAKRLGVSRSSFVSLILTDAAADLEDLLSELPDDIDEETAMRLRGQSIEIIMRRFAQLVASQ